MDRAALWSALGAGLVEVAAIDHCPFTRADRRRGTSGAGWADFTQIPGGLGGVETRLPATTISRGRVVATNGEPADSAGGRGEFVPRTVL